MCGSLIIPRYLEIESNGILIYAKKWDVTYSLKYFFYCKERTTENNFIKFSIQDGKKYKKISRKWMDKFIKQEAVNKLKAGTKKN